MDTTQFQQVTLNLVTDINGTLTQVNDGIADNNDNSNNLVLGVTALVVSLIALVSTILQVIQQYLASATDGYRRCTRRVMGRWSERTTRKYRWKQVRFEVRFETPVIFLAPPENKRGPMGTSEEHEIINLNGTEDSYDKSNLDKLQWKKPIHTANDELASWVTLLEAIQFEERDSRGWERDERAAQLNADAPPKSGQATAVMPINVDAMANRICHQIQKKKRSWDFMPPSTAKPFATTTLCHLVEMVALLGMYWRQFDVQRGGLAAEGNGYVFSSSRVWGLGLQMYFAVTGPHTFKDKRVIPCDAVKSLVFGIVPSILDRPLKLGNKDNVLRTLATFNCSPLTIENYEKKKKRTYMFSIAFEIIALLAKPFRLKGSMLRMLPNPTADTWLGDISKISWVDAMEHFQQTLKKMDSLQSALPNPLLEEIKKQWAETEQEWNVNQTRWEEKKKAEEERSKEEDEKKKLGQSGHNEKDVTKLHADFAPCMTIKLRDQLHNGLDGVQAVLKREHIEAPEICSVVAAHLGSVLDEADGLEATITRIGQNSTRNMVDYYFDHIRPRVMWEGVRTVIKDVVVDDQSPTGTTSAGGFASGFSGAGTSAANMSRRESVAFVYGGERRESSVAPLITERRGSAGTGTGAAASVVMPATDEETRITERRSAIWVSLIFRMISWSLLHDFDTGDINRIPSELVGSRMPVFIG